jgi:hypothetical protein
VFSKIKDFFYYYFIKRKTKNERDNSKLIITEDEIRSFQMHSFGEKKMQFTFINVVNQCLWYLMF